METKNERTQSNEGRSPDVGTNALMERIAAKISELEVEYKKENDEMHCLYAEWPAGAAAAQQRMFYAEAKLLLLKGLFSPNVKGEPCPPKTEK